MENYTLEERIEAVKTAIDYLSLEKTVQRYSDLINCINTLIYQLELLINEKNLLDAFKPNKPQP